MKSSVSNYVSYRDIPVPETLLTIEIPSWDEVAQPVVHRALFEYNQKHNLQETELTDQMVENLEYPGVSTLAQLKQVGMKVYEDIQSDAQYYNEVLPFILKYYYKTTNAVMNSEERDSYVSEYMEQIQAFADEEGMSIDQYGRQKMGLEDANIKEAFEQRALEDFNFKLIALDVAERRGLSLDEASYERFIQQNVLEKGMDEIDLREGLPYDRYKEIMPEYTLSHEIYEYFYPQIRFKINPDAEFKIIK